MINPEDFLNQSVEGQLSTSIIPIPVGEYQAAVIAVALRDFLFKKGDKAGMTGYALDVNWELADTSITEIIKRDAKIRQSMILDMSGQGLDMSEGCNITLGRIREAVGQNDGSAWSPNNLVGAVAVIQITQKMEGEDIYNEIKKVGKAA